MRVTLAEIAELTGGELAGDGDLVITGVASLEDAGPGDITFAKAEFVNKLAQCRASAVLTPRGAETEIPHVAVHDPYVAFVRVLAVVGRELAALPEGVHPSAVVGEGADLAAGVALGPCATVGAHTRIGLRSVVCANASVGPNCTIGEACVIHANVAVREGVTIGDRTILHSNTTIGGDGFGYLQADGHHVKIPQVGGVVIGDDVEIGCNCTVDRGTMGDTTIGNGVKIDNHSHIAHNCRIGDGCLLVAYARMGGSVVLGRNVVLAEDVGITDHVELGDGCIATGTARVSKSWPAGSVIGGSPAIKFDRAQRIAALQRRLPQICEQLREIREHLGLA